jgi:chain length determinant protein tyrosine kinase EpsG
MNAPLDFKPQGAIGDILVARGLLLPADVVRVVARQASHDEPFGEAAIALKLLDRADLDAALSTQFNYGYLQDEDAPLSRELVTAFKPFSRASEEMRALRGQLMLRWFNDDRRRRLLTVVSQRPRDGRSFIAANLAVVFSQQGQRTLLIDANLREPHQAKMFHTTGHSAGLAGILAGRAGLEVIESVPGLPGLRVLPAGAAPPNPQELVGMPSFGALLQQVSQNHDVVLIDTPASERFADAEIIAARTGAALLVARRHRSPLGGLGDLSRRLQDTGVALVGSVLNHY